MIVYKHESKDKIVLELSENEFTLLAYLTEKSSRKTKQENIIKEPIDVEMNKEFLRYMNEN